MSSASGQNQTIIEFVAELRRVPADGLMYARDPQGRALLEVLWLKLALLQELLRAAPHFGNVRVSTTAMGHLPRYWLFQIERGQTGESDASLPGPGSLWFTVLLSADASQVGAIRDVLATQSDSSTRARSLSASDLFSPSRVVDASSSVAWVMPDTGLWTSVLAIGLNLSAASDADMPRAVAEALRDTESLIRQVREQLFLDPPQLRDDLAAVLRDLIADSQWLESQIVPPRPAERPPPAPKPVSESKPAPTPPPVIEPPPEDMEATVIVKRHAVTTAPVTPALPIAEAAAPVEDLEQTVIVSRRGGPAQSSPAAQRPAPPPAAQFETEDLDATIIVPKDRKR